jgi:hypothetical protein
MLGCLVESRFLACVHCVLVLVELSVEEIGCLCPFALWGARIVTVSGTTLLEQAAPQH